MLAYPSSSAQAGVQAHKIHVFKSTSQAEYIQGLSNLALTLSRPYLEEKTTYLPDFKHTSQCACTQYSCVLQAISLAVYMLIISNVVWNICTPSLEDRTLCLMKIKQTSKCACTLFSCMLVTISHILVYLIKGGALDQLVLLSFHCPPFFTGIMFGFERSYIKPS